MKKELPFTTRQVGFIQEFLACGNATASAVKAGFSPKGASVAGSRMLRNVRVQNAIQARQAADATRLSIQREDVLAALLEAVNQARVQANPMAMISGLREIGRMMGFYAPEGFKVDVRIGHGDNLAKYAAMSDQELMAVMARPELQN
jgi:phage terminase small subunit